MKTIYKGDSRYEKVFEQMQLLDIQDVSTKQQVKNGTIVWRLPILSDKRNTYIEYAAFASGYVRNQGVDCHSNWQINKCKMNKRYYKYPDGKVHELPKNFGFHDAEPVAGTREKEAITEWFNYKGLTYVAE